MIGMNRVSKICFAAIVPALLLAAAAAGGAEHLVRPGQPPQPILDAAAAGDTIVLLPGLHQHGLGRHRAILSVEKPISIELRAGATLKLADGATKLEAIPEITTDQDAGKKLDDLELGGTFDLLRPAIFTIRIDGEGRPAADGQPARPDTFSWGVFEDVLNPDGSAQVAASPSKFNETPHTGIPITGDWQELSRGVAVRFGSTTGHNKGSTWFASYDGPEAYGIRIGHGIQPEYIENVRITGRGTIDMNTSRNVQPTFLVKDINACVLVHGRVRDVLIQGITMVDSNRSVMCYGAHTGALLPGGDVGPGESFDAEKITIVGTRTLNPQGAGYLLGHPSHRGRLRDVKCNHNYMETGVTCIEPNFNLDGYEVIGNIMKSGGLTIHCWRHSKNGTIADNLRIHDNAGQPVVVFGAPRGWQPPEKPVLRDNRNPLSEALAAHAATAAENGRRFDLEKRASEIDPAAKEHPEIGFTFSDAQGKPIDVQHAVVDTRVPARGRLVIWLMPHSPGLFDRIAGYGLHGIQVAYANRWFGLIDPAVRDSGDVLGKIRLEAATGDDHSPLVEIPKPDGMQERARQFLLWLDRENPAGNWKQFLTDDAADLRWDKVIMAGISHGSTTAARFAVHRPVDRVVMFSGPRDQTESWQELPSATPSARFFGFTHVLDGGWTADHYCRSWQLLGMHAHGPVVNVDEAAPPYGDTRRLITTADVGGSPDRAHTCVIPDGSAVKNADRTLAHEAVWRYLFTHPVEQSGAAVPLDAECGMEQNALAQLVDGPVAPRELAGGFAFTEGPAADAAGDVFFTDIPNQRIHVWRAATGKVEPWLENTDKANGLFFAANGTLLACQMGAGRRLVAIDPATKQVTTVAERIDGKRFNAPNDLVADAAGGIWFTDPAYGREPAELEIGQEAVYWISPDRTTVTRVADALRRPNGIAFSPDGKTLYVADRDGDVTYAYPVEGPGRLGPRKTFADTGSDGFAVDERGNLYVTPKANHVRVFAPSGRKLGEIPLPAPPSNVTFGGPGRKTLFITARDKVYTLPMHVAGGG